MSTRPFKDIEQMMRAASEDFEQPFEEAAWHKMEVLLDDEKDRRRPFFWLWWLLPVFIGAGIGGYFIFSSGDQPGQSVTTPATKPGEPGSSLAATKAASPAGSGASKALPSSRTGEHTKLPVANDKSLSNHNPAQDQKQAAGNDRQGNIMHSEPSKNTDGRSKKSFGTSAQAMVKTGGNTLVADSGSQPGTQVGHAVPIVTGIEKNNPDTSMKSAGNKKLPVEKTIPPAPGSAGTDKSKTLQNKETGKQSRWYVMVAAGAEGSSPRVFSVDKISARGGVTFGFQLDKNFSLQTGLFAGSKKYIAGPKDYKAKAGSYWSTVELLEVEANCLVLEIPLDVRYDLHPEKKTNFFTTAGLSSYIMSKEDYEYLYNRYGYLHYVEAGYKGNKHILAVLRFSAGIDTKISKTLSLNAAPALSIPLAGVGEGQVRLYSTEIMVGLRYQPLKKIKHK